MINKVNLELSVKHDTHYDELQKAVYNLEIENSDITFAEVENSHEVSIQCSDNNLSTESQI